MPEKPYFPRADGVRKAAVSRLCHCRAALQTRPSQYYQDNHLLTMKINKILAAPIAASMLLMASAAGAQTVGPMVALQFGTNGLTSPLTANSSNAVVARLLLDTTGSTEAVRINAIPFNLVTGSGANASTLRNCRVYNEADTSTALNGSSSTTAMSNGINNIALNSALVIPANSMVTLSLRCDVGPDLVSGGTYTVNLNTNNVVATGASSGLPAAVTIRGAVAVPPVVVIPTTPATPGMPATGAAGEAAQNIAMLVASLLIASLGFSYVNSRKRA